MLNNELTWGDHVDQLIKKLNSRLYCLRKIASFNVRSEKLCMFYISTICGVWRYCLICWGGNVCKIERNRIDRLIRNAERVIGVELEPVDSVYRGLLDRKLQSVWDDSGHPMHALLSGRVSLRHSGRLRLPSLATNRYREFFTVRAIKLFNEKLQTDCILPSKLSWAIEMLT